jgi:hypothetical protein
MAGTDWETIETEYRAGSLSVNEIARQAGVTPQAIRNRARRNGWQRDLSEQVRQATRAKLVTDAVTPGVTPAPAGQIIAAASDRNVAMVQLHRKDGEKLRTRADVLLTMFDTMAATAMIVKDVAMLASILSDATTVTQKVIQIERQAYNLDAPTAGDDAVSKDQAMRAAQLMVEG